MKVLNLNILFFGICCLVNAAQAMEYPNLTINVHVENNFQNSRFTHCQPKKQNTRQVKKNGNTPLHLAVYNKDQVKVENLLKHDAEINALNTKGLTPLCLACDQGNFDIAELLIKNGANPNLIGNNANSALHATLGSNSLSTTKRWLEYDSDSDTENVSKHKEQIVAYNNYIRIGSLLLTHNASINTQNKYGCTPLHMALMRGNLEMVEQMVARKPLLLTDNKKRNFLHCAVWGGSVDCFKRIIDYITSDHQKEKLKLINGQSIYHETPLFNAATQANYSIASLLVKNGANVNTQNDAKKRTPLLACLRVHINNDVIHAKSDEQLLRIKQNNRFSHNEIVAFIKALKQSPDLDLDIKDDWGWGAQRYIDCILDKDNRVHLRGILGSLDPKNEDQKRVPLDYISNKNEKRKYEESSSNERKSKRRKMK